MRGPAVIVQIAGGLGNQLFEYAFGRSLALRNDVPLVLDHRSCFPHDFYKRIFTLDKYPIQCDLVAPSEDRSSLFGRAQRRLGRWRNEGLPIARRSQVLERDEFAWDPEVTGMRITRPTWFEGVWQHEEYFAAHRLQRNRALGRLATGSHAGQPQVAALLLQVDQARSAELQHTGHEAGGGLGLALGADVDAQR